ncbi:MAG: AAA family ATPase [Clostridia bacterium]|nr:AAA family ATPase [Clostridia bacterium]
MLTKKLPVGIEDFEEMRKQDFYYVDKTGLIVDLLAGWGKVNLFTRPRRFGKTLNMSMLKCFFEIGTDKSLFDGLAVSKEKALCEKYMGKYPVVFVSLKDVDGLTFEDAYNMLRATIREEACRLHFLMDSDALTEYEKQVLQKLMGMDAKFSDITNSLLMLCALLEKHYGQKTILLIDEYDVPLAKAYANGYYPQMLDVLHAMLLAALKTNSSLFFAVLTGCLRISNESVFTGLNNMKMHTISDVRFDEYFGFTDEEVGEMLSYYGLEAHYDTMRVWYKGYRFGKQDVYCPWDVINYVYALRFNPEAAPKPYWMNTSGNDIVCRLIANATDGTSQMEIERLIAGETITKTLNEQLTHDEIDANRKNLWSLLYMTGYLTATETPYGDRYTLRLPNREIQQAFKQQVLSWFKDKARAETDKLTNLYAAFETGDTETIKEILDEQLLDTVSFYDAHESFYHGFLLALLSTCASWNVSSNIETGKGRSDILVSRKDRKIGFVVEVKDVKDEDKLDAACEAGMKQIEEKDYTALLRRFRVKEIWTYAIAFWDKECRIAAKCVTKERRDG